MTKIKIGANVNAKSSRGELQTGRVVGQRQTPHGTWLDVNLAPKGSKKPDIRSYRPASVTVI